MPVEVERETEVNIWIDGRRRKKQARWERYWPSFEEAAAYLTKNHAERIASEKDALKRATKNQRKFHEWLEKQSKDI